MKLAVNFNEITVGVAEMSRAGLPDWAIHRSGDLFSTALDEIGIGGVDVIYAENDDCLMTYRHWRRGRFA